MYNMKNNDTVWSNHDFTVLSDDLLGRDAKQLGPHVNFLIDIKAWNYEEDPWLRWKLWQFSIFFHIIDLDPVYLLEA